MTDLDHLLAELPVEPAPLDELVVRGHHRRMRRRFVGAAATAAAVVVIASGVVALSGGDGPSGRAVDPAGPSETPSVRVIGTDSSEFDLLYPQLDGAEPFWEAETESVYYLSGPSYSSSCPPLGKVTTDGDAMTLTLEDDPAVQDCTADAGAVIAVVEHVPEKPDELTISDISTQRTLPLLEGHPVVVHTDLVGPEVHYIEGALVQTSLVTDTGVDRVIVGEVGTVRTFRGVPEGTTTVKGATRICNGNCGSLSEPADACEAPVDVDGGTEAAITFRWGTGCEVEAP
jgi:hypothetical protein